MSLTRFDMLAVGNYFRFAGTGDTTVWEKIDERSAKQQTGDIVKEIHLDMLVNTVDRKDDAEKLILQTVVKEGSRWKNRKTGSVYTVKDIGINSETLEPMVSYRCSIDKYNWVRPLTLFLSKFEPSV